MKTTRKDSASIDGFARHDFSKLDPWLLMQLNAVKCGSIKYASSRPRQSCRETCCPSISGRNYMKLRSWRFPISADPLPKRRNYIERQMKAASGAKRSPQNSGNNRDHSISEAGRQSVIGGRSRGSKKGSHICPDTYSCSQVSLWSVNQLHTTEFHFIH